MHRINSRFLTVFAGFSILLALAAAEAASGGGTEPAFTWNLRHPNEPGVFLDAVLQPRGRDGARRIEYHRNGRLLEEDACRAAGLPLAWRETPPVSCRTSAAPADKARPETAPVPPGSSAGIMPEIITVPAPDMRVVHAEDKAGLPGDEKGLARIGVYRKLPAILRPGPGGWVRIEDGSLIWSMAFEAPGALGLRMECRDLMLPPGAEFYFYSLLHPERRHGPLTPESGTAEWWTPACYTELAVFECRLPAGAEPEKADFIINRAAWLYRSPLDLVMAKDAGACNLDVTCYPEWAETALSIGGLGVAGSAGILFCTCTLLADSIASNEPWVITANHCVRGQTGSRGADSLEFYWEFQTAACDDTPPSPAAVPRTTGGAWYLAGAAGTGYTGGGNDFTFMRMVNDPPANLPRAGWTTAIPALAAEVACVHHPRGTFKRIAFGNTTDLENNYDTLYHEVTWHDGTTEPGSSGSPLFTTAEQHFIGQLWGGGASCTEPLEPDYYGRFDVTWQIVRPWIDPPRPAVAFAEQTLTAAEDGGALTVTVNLSGASGYEGIQVDWELTPVTAQPDHDYTGPVSGTLYFDNSHLSSSFTIGIVDDIRPEQDETFTITLRNPVNCVLNEGGATAVVTILDNDPDSDGDGLSDEEELTGSAGAVTDPGNPDSDYDGLTDFEELRGVFSYVTDPNNPDTDNDGIPDYLEIFFGLNPLDATDAEAVSSIRMPLFETR
jgi:lysyl endopeptidase